jgi:hypothetical protein
MSAKGCKMKTDEKPNSSLIDFARKLAGISETEPVEGFNFTQPAPESGASTSAPAPANEDSTAPRDPPKKPDALTADLQSTHASQLTTPTTSGKKQLKTPDEIAMLIMTTLRSIDNCPDRGFIITVYGSNPWNAMLTIRPEAGTSIDRSLWLSRVQEIGMQLREDFDVIQETTVITGDIGHEFADLAGRDRPSHETDST